MNLNKTKIIKIILSVAFFCYCSVVLFFSVKQAINKTRKEKNMSGNIFCTIPGQVISYEYVGKPKWKDRHLFFTTPSGDKVETNFPCTIIYEFSK